MFKAENLQSSIKKRNNRRQHSSECATDENDGKTLKVGRWNTASVAKFEDLEAANINVDAHNT